MHRLFLAVFSLCLIVVVAVGSQRNRKAGPGSNKPTVHHAIGAIHPRLSPDGGTAVFSYQGAIWKLPCETTLKTGGTMVRLTEAAGYDIEPAWSPDGKQIAYVNSNNMRSGNLRIIDANTGNPIPIAKRVTASGKLYFHPDNRQIFGLFAVPGKGTGIASYHRLTGQLRFLTSSNSRARFALSNNGQSVVFVKTMDVRGQQGGNDGPRAEIWRLSSEGGDPVRIMTFPSRIHDLCFAADDGALLVVSDLGGVYYDIWHVPLNDPIRSKRKLTHGQADEHRPSVSLDGKRLLYTDNRNNATALMMRNLTTGIDHSLAISRMVFRRPTGILKLNTRDATSGKLVTARVSIEKENGKYFAPVGSLHRMLKNYGHFYCDGTSELTLPAGKYRLRALRGPEYRATYREFDVRIGGRRELDVELERWIYMAENGWFSGENHIHANYGYGEWYNTPETMLQQSSGENINVSNFMVANSDTNGVFDRSFFRGRPDPLSTDETILYWNQEFRSTIWGHMTLVNLKHVVEPVFTGFKDTTNPWDIPTNSDIADKTHLQNGLVNYTHVAQNPNDPYQNPYTGKSIPVDVALGKIDTLDLNASYAGTTVLWYKLLNCGFHLPASAGTDCFLNRIVSRLPGGDRAYVHVDGPFSYDAWIKGLRGGRSFVTNGPMLELSANDRPLGDTVRLAGSGAVAIAGVAKAQFPLERVELIYNGKVVASALLASDQLSAKLDQKIDVDRSGWLALRAIGPGHLDHPLGSQYAHTSPIYLEIADQPAGSREDAEYFLKWIDRLSLAIRLRDRIPSDELRKHVESQFEAARQVYLKIAERSKKD